MEFPFIFPLTKQTMVTTYKYPIVTIILAFVLRVGVHAT